MPTYEYVCDKCGGEFEYLQGIKEDPKAVCDKCGGHLTKLLSAGTGLIFKGSGFYITDYKSKSGGESSEGKPAAEKKADSPGATKAESSTKSPAANTPSSNSSNSTKD